MRKILLVLVFAVASIVCKAQLFIGGSVSGYYQGSSIENSYGVVDNYTPKYGIVLTPTVGYMLPQGIGGGISFGYSYGSKEGFDDIKGENYNAVYSSAYDIAPFFRFVYGKFDKITLYADAKLPIGASKEKAKRAGEFKDYGETFFFGVRLIPGLTYKFTEHILFTTEIGLLSLNYIFTKNTSENGSTKRTNDFTFGANKRTLASFGFVYLF